MKLKEEKYVLPQKHNVLTVMVILLHHSKQLIVKLLKHNVLIEISEAESTKYHFWNNEI